MLRNSPISYQDLDGHKEWSRPPVEREVIDYQSSPRPSADSHTSRYLRPAHNLHSLLIRGGALYRFITVEKKYQPLRIYFSSPLKRAEKTENGGAGDEKVVC